MDMCFNKTSPSPVALQLNDCVLKQHNVIKLLGVYIQADLKWDAHVAKIISKANSRLYILRRLKHHGLPYSDLLTVYLSIMRPLMEYATPVWAGGITKKQEEDIERIPKRACQIILGKEYTGYIDARDRLHLITLSDRRRNLCLTFAQSMLDTTSKLHYLLPPTLSGAYNTRNKHLLQNIKCKTVRFKNSEIPFLCRLLNGQL